MALLQVPSAPAVVVPRLVTPSKASTVLLGAAVPESTGEAFTVWPLMGEAMTGAAGATLSMVTPTEEEVAETLPAASLALAVKRCEPSVSTPVV